MTNAAQAPHGARERTPRATPVFFSSLRGYRRAWLRGDLVAGLTVWAVLVPEALAYASIVARDAQEVPRAWLQAGIGRGAIGTYADDGRAWQPVEDRAGEQAEGDGDVRDDDAAVHLVADQALAFEGPRGLAEGTAGDAELGGDGGFAQRHARPQPAGQDGLPDGFGGTGNCRREFIHGRCSA